MWTIFCSTLFLGSVVGNNISGKGRGGRVVCVRGGGGNVNKNLGSSIKRRGRKYAYFRGEDGEETSPT